MKEYEIVSFVKENAGSKDPVKDATGVVSDILTQQGGEILKNDSLGRRPMGYKIDHQKEAQFVVTHCRLKPDSVAKLTRAFQLNNQVLTATVTRKETKVAKVLMPQDSRPVKKPDRGRTQPPHK